MYDLDIIGRRIEELKKKKIKANRFLNEVLFAIYGLHSQFKCS